MNFRQSKGNSSSIADDTLIKRHMHNNNILLYIQYKFHETPSLGYLVMTEDGKKSLKFRQSKGNNSSITDDTMMKLIMHNNTMVIYIQYKFQEISFIGYLVMAEDGNKKLKFRQSKGDNSSITSITKDTLMDLYMHNHHMVIYIQYKFHEIPSIGYLVMA